jgi:putative ABC transport system substrate-binding protein
MNARAQLLKVEIQPVEIRSAQDFSGALSALAQRRSEAFIVADDSMLRTYGRTIAELAATRRVPSIGDREYVQDGGLLAYAVNRPQVWRRAATFVDKILKGAKPADLPVEQPTKFELVVNLKTAKALGLTIPQTLLLRADQIIE